MRNAPARCTLAGLVGIALAGCGSSATSLPLGAVPNNSGGGSVPVTSQNPPGSIVPGVLVDGGVVSETNTYSGVNATVTDTQSALDAGTDPATGGSGTPPENPAGSHAVTFAGSGASQIILVSSATLPALYYANAVPGQIMPLTYGAIVLYAGVVAASPAPASGAPKIALELTGGSNATSYDVRSTCGLLPAKGTTPPVPLARYVCALPAYGATAGTTGSVTLVAASTTGGVTTPAVTTSYLVDSNIPNPRIADTSGSFTPATAKLYVELVYGSSTSTASTGNVLDLDYLYAEAGTK